MVQTELLLNWTHLMSTSVKMTLKMNVFVPFKAACYSILGYISFYMLSLTMPPPFWHSPLTLFRPTAAHKIPTLHQLHDLGLSSLSCPSPHIPVAACRLSWCVITLD